MWHRTQRRLGLRDEPPDLDRPNALVAIERREPEPHRRGMGIAPIVRILDALQPKRVGEVDWVVSDVAVGVGFIRRPSRPVHWVRGEEHAGGGVVGAVRHSLVSPRPNSPAPARPQARQRTPAEYFTGLSQSRSGTRGKKSPARPPAIRSPATMMMVSGDGPSLNVLVRSQGSIRSQD